MDDRLDTVLNRRALLATVALAPALIAGCSRAADATPSPPWEDKPFSLDAMKAGGPDEWHRYALFANWDFDEGGFDWIVRQPQCDRATALAVFWLSSPDYYFDFARAADVPPTDRVGYDRIVYIRDRWVAGGYVRAELAFDLATDYAPVDFAALERKYGARLAQLIPVSMRRPLAGRRLTQDGRTYPGVFVTGDGG